MLRATKTTKKVLENIMKEANKKNYYSNEENTAYMLLNWINEADKDAQTYEECKQYNLMEDYKRSNCYYCVNGLCINGAWGEQEYTLRGLSINHNDIFKYTCCLDLNEAIIKDINKLVKVLYRA
jgi:hypothetical protein